MSAWDAVQMVVFVPLVAYFIAVGGRRFAWGWLAIIAALDLLPPLGVPSLAVWLIGMVAYLVVDRLPYWHDDPPREYMALAIKYLIRPWVARRAWWRARRDAPQSQLVGVAFRRGNSEREAALLSTDVPFTMTHATSGLTIVVRGVVVGRRGVILLASAGPRRPRGGRRQRVRFEVGQASEVLQ